MARVTYSMDHLLDCTRDVLLDLGPRATTVAAIAERAGAPTGSLYHRFASVDEMLARAWLRAVLGTQRARPVGDIDVAALALELYDHCVAYPRDMLLLDRFRLDDIAALQLDDELRREIDTANARTGRLMTQLARAVYGRSRKAEVDLLTLAIVDLPFAFAQRYLHEGTPPPASRRERLPAAVRAVLSEL